MFKKTQKPDEGSEKTDTEHVVTEEALVEGGNDQAVKQKWYKRWWQWLLTHKKISIPGAVVVLALVLAVVPFTRYSLAGLVFKQTLPVRVVDTQTGKPVSNATVLLNGQSAETDKEGKAELRTKIGKANLTVTKKYYDETKTSILVPIKKPSRLDIRLKAVGRAVPVAVLNRISKQPVGDVTIAAEGTEAKTDDKGKTTLVVPADKKEIEATLSGEGFNRATVKLVVTANEVEANVFSVTPAGKIYFLSNASGKIDLVKSNLDGTERQTVLAGTGKEDRHNTILLASPDWKYIALLSKRDGGDSAKLFLIETATDKVTTMDEGEATFSVYGWSNDRFIYKVTRDPVKTYEPKRESIKSYHAPTKKITTLDDTAAEGNGGDYAQEYFGETYILNQEIVFVKTWTAFLSGHYNTARLGDKQATLNSIRVDGSQKKVIKGYKDFFIGTRTAEFGEIYISFDEGGISKVDEYHDGKLVAIDQSPEDFQNESYPYYSVSPTGEKTLWSVSIDGKNTFSVGDAKGENGREIGRSEEYSVYGWFTDNYVLVTKRGSEMHIVPAGGLRNGLETTFKITDYYKPDYQNRGFGYGYGG